MSLAGLPCAVAFEYSRLEFKTQIPYRLAFYHSVQIVKHDEDENLVLVWMCIIDQIVETVLKPLHMHTAVNDKVTIASTVCALGFVATMGGKDRGGCLPTPYIDCAPLSPQRLLCDKHSCKPKIK